jgi:hypothetical protein
MPREPEQWGGDVHLPGWLRHLLHRPDPAGDTLERAHERRQPGQAPSVLENANRAASGSLADLYNEDRRRKGK